MYIKYSLVSVVLFCGTLLLGNQYHFASLSKTSPNTDAFAPASPTVQLPQDLPSGTILLKSPHALWIVDPPTLKWRLYTNTTPDDGEQIRDIVIPLGGKYIYIEQTSAKGDLTPTDDVKVTRLNLATGGRELIFQKAGIVGIDLSPNGFSGIVKYLVNPKDPNHGVPITFCVLNMSTGDCPESGLHISSAMWSDDNTIIGVPENRASAYLVNASTLKTQALNLQNRWLSIDAIAVISNQSKLLVVGKSSFSHKTEFAILDQGTSTLSVLPYSIARDYYAVMEALMISPDGRYIMYGRSGHYILARLEDGQTIAEVNDIAFPQWTSDSMSIIAIVGKDEQYMLQRFDVSTGKLMASATLSETASLTAVP